MFRFTCNICCAECSVASAKDLEREKITCERCGSTVRFRWMVHALSMELFGKSLPLPQFPERRSLRGIGMSDWEMLAAALQQRFDFRNTFLHADPKLDVLNPGPEDWAAFDFVLSSEVFEHIPPPIQRAFDNLARILRPKGFVVFTVPWKPEGKTEEHYPSLHDWRIEQNESGERVLINRTRDNQTEVFRSLYFHGGGGQTLEMRFFSRSDLLLCLRKAGFKKVAFSRLEEKPEFGIVWEGDFSLGLVARKRGGVFDHAKSWGLRLRHRVPYVWRCRLGRIRRRAYARAMHWLRRGGEKQETQPQRIPPASE